MCVQIIFWNACGGLASKINTVQTIIDQFSPEALFISESEVTEINKSWFAVQNYDLITSKVINHGKSRLICLLKVNSFLTHKPELVTRDTVEAIVLESHLVRIVGVYRPFALINNQTKSAARDDFISTLYELSSSMKKLWIAGDFNVNMNKSDSETLKL
jgi:exonuclease III